MVDDGDGDAVGSVNDNGDEVLFEASARAHARCAHPHDEVGDVLYY